MRNSKLLRYLCKSCSDISIGVFLLIEDAIEVTKKGAKNGQTVGDGARNDGVVL